jgi:hypothetical protein
MSYIGIDIVPDLIAENKRKYADPHHRFLLADITTDSLLLETYSCAEIV